MITDLARLEPGSTILRPEDRATEFDISSSVPIPTEVLLEVSDNIRYALKLKAGINAQYVQQLDSLLRRLAKDETEGVHLLHFSTIADARLDKLLEALVAAKFGIHSSVPKFKDIVAKGIVNYSLWQKQFGPRLHTIEQYRSAEMKETGSLAGMTLNPTWDINKPLWVTKRHGAIRAGSFGHQGFEIGSWWLNTECAYRDGAISSMSGALKSCIVGVTNLVMIGGEEVEGPKEGQSTYIREITGKVRCSRLMLYLGNTVRLLRHYTLKSKMAPRAGLRYDGMYKLDQYGLKLEDPSKNTYRTTLTLLALEVSDKIIPGGIPTASQLDEWEGCKKMEDDYVQAKLGLTEFEKWKAKQQEEEGERRRWLGRHGGGDAEENEFVFFPI